MGCDIHMITEIRKGDKWEYVPEVPQSLDQRNYSTFAFLAGVRDSFDTTGFAPRGLPKDISNKRFRFESYTPQYHRVYENESNTWLLVDGVYHSLYSELAIKAEIEIDASTYKSLCENKELSNRYFCAYSSHRDTVRYFVRDAFLVNGKVVRVPYNVVYKTFKDFVENYADEDDWDETMQDYGRWEIDFDCEDYHTPSWLSLKDLLDADYTDYTKVKYKLDREFYNVFTAAGGVFPDAITVEEKSCVGTIADAIREAMLPTVLLSWQMSGEKKKSLPLFKGIEELKTIAEQYNIKNPEDIRIVFAFDN